MHDDNVLLPKGAHLLYKGISVTLTEDTLVVSDILARHGTPEAWNRYVDEHFSKGFTVESCQDTACAAKRTV